MKLLILTALACILLIGCSQTYNFEEQKQNIEFPSNYSAYEKWNFGSAGGSGHYEVKFEVEDSALISAEGRYIYSGGIDTRIDRDMGFEEIKNKSFTYLDPMSIFYRLNESNSTFSFEKGLRDCHYTNNFKFICFANNQLVNFDGVDYPHHNLRWNILEYPFDFTRTDLIDASHNTKNFSSCTADLDCVEITEGVCKRNKKHDQKCVVAINTKYRNAWEQIPLTEDTCLPGICVYTSNKPVCKNNVCSVSINETNKPPIKLQIENNSAME